MRCGDDGHRPVSGKFKGVILEEYYISWYVVPSFLVPLLSGHKRLQIKCVSIFQILFFNCKVVIKYALSNYKDLGGAYIHHREGQIIKKEKIIKLIIKFSKDQNSYNGI